MNILLKAITYIVTVVLIAGSLTLGPSLAVAKGERRFVSSGGPFYFLAIHNEPMPAGSRLIHDSFQILVKMVKQADNYNIKLTLMFTAQWAEYITSDEQRLEIVRDWAAHGHEIAAHHHGIWHQAWDGFSDYDLDLVYEVRSEFDQNEPYNGRLDDYMAWLYLLNPDMTAGCVNDEDDKHALPDQIIYDTCSGYANWGPMGEVVSDEEPQKGINNYISVGSYKGIERRWLTHTFIGAVGLLDGAVEAFLSMDSGIFGTINHSLSKEQEAYTAYLEFLHKYDPAGLKSGTVSSLINAHIIHLQYFDDEFEPFYSCGDLVCSEYEQENPDECPLDCQ